jgi:hypothetical protein
VTRPTPREHLDRAVPEAEVQAVIVDVLGLCGYLWHHETDSRRSHAGLPDIVAVHPVSGTVLFVECKRETGRLSAAQLVWADGLRSAQAAWPGTGPGLAYHLARPSNLDDVLGAVHAGARHPGRGL